VGHEYPVQAAASAISATLTLPPPPIAAAATTSTNTTILAEGCVHFSYSLKLLKAALPDYTLYTAHSIG